jgi:hypothetical protein
MPGLQDGDKNLEFVVHADPHGSLWIMANLNHNMMPMDQIMQMQR